MTYYIYQQNNSGGVFINPAINVVVKADSPEQADAIATANGVYFDSELDCECCGERWSTAGEWTASETIPAVSDSVIRWAKADSVSAQIVIE